MEETFTGGLEKGIFGGQHSLKNVFLKSRNSLKKFWEKTEGKL